MNGSDLESWLAKAAPDRIWWMGTPPPCFQSTGNQVAEQVYAWGAAMATWVVQIHGGGVIGLSASGAQRMMAARSMLSPGHMDVGPPGHRVPILRDNEVSFERAPVAWIRPNIDGVVSSVVVAFVEYPGLYDDLGGYQRLAKDAAAEEAKEHPASWRGRKTSRYWVKDP